MTKPFQGAAYWLSDHLWGGQKSYRWLVGFMLFET